MKLNCFLCLISVNYAYTLAGLPTRSRAVLSTALQVQSNSWTAVISNRGVPCTVKNVISCFALLLSLAICFFNIKSS